jgi:hypothetical protein
MERTIRQVNLWLIRNGMGTGNIYIFSVLVMAFFAVPLSARFQTSTEYLLVEHVERLLVYNRYQQHISKEEQRMITPFVPMKILDAKATLNDDFTPCLKVEIQGSVFFLLQNDVREFPNKSKLGFVHIYNHAALVNDTIRLTSSTITFTSPDQKKNRLMQKGNILIRCFRDKKNTFVKLNGLRQEYGWVVLPDRNKEEYIVLSAKERSDPGYFLSNEIQKRIQSKLAEANRTLNDLFAYFNSETNARKAVPRWRFVVLDQQYVCMLEPEEYTERYAESTRYLAGDIDNILHGTNYTTVSAPGKIEIRFK